MVEFCVIGDIQIAYETFGNETQEAMVLLSGLGGEMRDWPEEVVSQLTDAGFFIIRIDHRDSGASSEISSPVDVISAFLGNKTAAAYTLRDMAGDMKAVLDNLGISSVHMVGVSMGAMVAQQFCVDFPAYVRSLCSIMSTTGARNVGQPSAEVVAAVLSGVAPELKKGGDPAATQGKNTIEAILELGDLEEVKASIEKTASNAPDLEQILRQLAAVFASGDRTEALRQLKIPTVVIHGDSDSVVDVSGGVATHEAISGSKLFIIPGMGHEIRPEHWPRIRDALLENVEASRGFFSDS